MVHCFGTEAWSLKLKIHFSYSATICANFSLPIKQYILQKIQWNLKNKDQRSKLVKCALALNKVFWASVYTGCPIKNAQRLIWCKLKMTLLTQSVFIFSKSSCFNLKFGIKQTTIDWKLAMEWLPKTKILGPTKGRRPGFFPKMHQFKAAILLYQSYWSIKISWNRKRHSCFT